MTSEEQRPAEASEGRVNWRTVREDYSEGGSARDYFTHDAARSRAYRWGEDGIAGISDEQHRLCFSVALWNERDPILKERLVGLITTPGGSIGVGISPGDASYPDPYYYVSPWPYPPVDRGRPLSACPAETGGAVTNILNHQPGIRRHFPD